ncbi:MAG: sulfite exporter TauE/SafE family protein [Chloroflexi bacterium]|nr:sulfite exporter TauE/SafE family protein [Chloroflexota bacterium]
MQDALLLALLATLGLAGAFFSGLVGLGGAIILIPALFYIPHTLGVGHLDMKLVAAIAIVQVFFASVSGVVGHWRNKMVSRDLVIHMGTTSLLGSLAGAIISQYLQADVITIVFASMALLSAALMFVPREEQGADFTAEQVTFNRPLSVLLAFVVAFLAGIVGAGGAFVLVPLMLHVLKIPTRVVVGSALGVVLLSSTGGLIGKLGTGQVSLLLASVLVLGALPGAQLGAFVSKRMQVRALRLVLIVVISAIAAKMWYDVLVAR